MNYELQNGLVRIISWRNLAKRSRLRQIIKRNESIWGLKGELYKIKYKNTTILSFIKDKIIIFAANFIYKRYDSDCKTKLS